MLGALTTHDAIERSALVRSRWTALADASAIVGSPATRHVGTLGGNLANASPAMETGAPLVVFGAEVELRSSGGSRTVPVESLWAGPGRTTAAPGEMITGVTVPAPGGRLGQRVRAARVPAVDGDRGGRSGGARDARRRRDRVPTRGSP